MGALTHRARSASGAAAAAAAVAAAAAAVAVVVAAGCVSYTIDDPTIIACAGDDDCPANATCQPAAGRCVPRGGETEPPSASLTLDPGPFRAGVAVALAIDATEPLLAPPVAVVAAVDAAAGATVELPFVVTVADAVTAGGAYVPTGDEPEGEHDVVVELIDAAGNAGRVVAAGAVAFDFTAPALGDPVAEPSSYSAAGGGGGGGDGVLTVPVDEPVAAARAWLDERNVGPELTRVDDGGAATLRFALDAAILGAAGDGVHGVVVDVEDAAGNLASRTAAGVLSVDNGAPGAPTLTALGPTRVRGGDTVTVGIALADGDDDVDTGALVVELVGPLPLETATALTVSGLTASLVVTAALADGDYRVDVRNVVDVAGNAGPGASLDGLVTIDNDAPGAVFLDLGADDRALGPGRGVSFELLADEPVALPLVSIDDGAAPPLTLGLDVVVTPLDDAPGRHFLVTVDALAPGPVLDAASSPSAGARLTLVGTVVLVDDVDNGAVFALGTFDVDAKPPALVDAAVNDGGGTVEFARGANIVLTVEASEPLGSVALTVLGPDGAPRPGFFSGALVSGDSGASFTHAVAAADADGAYTIGLALADAGGNGASFGGPVVRVDSVPPLIDDLTVSLPLPEPVAPGEPRLAAVPPVVSVNPGYDAALVRFTLEEGVDLDGGVVGAGQPAFALELDGVDVGGGGACTRGAPAPTDVECLVTLDPFAFAPGARDDGVLAFIARATDRALNTAVAVGVVRLDNTPPALGAPEVTLDGDGVGGEPRVPDRRGVGSGTVLGVIALANEPVSALSAQAVGPGGAVIDLDETGEDFGALGDRVRAFATRIRPSPAVPEGNYRVLVSAVDLGGNGATATGELCVDEGPGGGGGGGGGPGGCGSGIVDVPFDFTPPAPPAVAPGLVVMERRPSAPAPATIVRAGAGAVAEPGFVLARESPEQFSRRVPDGAPLPVTPDAAFEIAFDRDVSVVWLEFIDAAGNVSPLVAVRDTELRLDSAGLGVSSVGNPTRVETLSQLPRSPFGSGEKGAPNAAERARLHADDAPAVPPLEVTGAARFLTRTFFSDRPGIGAAAAFAPASGETVFFGGTNGDGSPIGDTFRADAETGRFNFAFGSAGDGTPPARVLSALAYDEDRGVLVLFGGERDFLSLLGDAWELDVQRGTWTEIVLEGDAPPARREHAMAWDGRRVVLFGGCAAPCFGAGALGDAWAFDATLRTFVPLEDDGGPRPAARAQHAMAYDPVRGAAVLFGGRADGGAFLDDTWELRDGVFTQLSPAGAPSARGEHAMAFVAAAQGVLLFGGADAGGPRDDAFVLRRDGAGADLFEAVAVSGPRPSPRARASLAGDAGGRALLAGGVDNFSDQLFDDIWLFDGARFIAQRPQQQPFNLGGPALAVDPDSGHFLLFGGSRNTNELHAVWSFDVDAAAWSPVFVAPPGTIPYGDRAGMSATLDEERGRVLLFGGRNGDNSLANELVIYDIAQNAFPPTPVTPSPPPPPREQHVAVFDTLRDRLVIIGGLAGDAFTWTDAGGWQPLPLTGTALPALEQAAAAYDPLLDVILLQGGRDGAGALQGLTYEIGAGSGVVTVPAQIALPGRAGAGMVFDEAAGRALLVGGSDDNGPRGEVFRFDEALHQWRSATPPDGEPNPSGGTAFAYDVARGRGLVHGGGPENTDVTEVRGGAVGRGPALLWFLPLTTGGFGDFSAPPFLRDELVSLDFAVDASGLGDGGATGAALHVWDAARGDYLTLASGDGTAPLAASLQTPGAFFAGSETFNTPQLVAVITPRVAPGDDVGGGAVSVDFLDATLTARRGAGFDVDLTAPGFVAAEGAVQALPGGALRFDAALAPAAAPSLTTPAIAAAVEFRRRVLVTLSSTSDIALVELRYQRAGGAVHDFTDGDAVSFPPAGTFDFPSPPPGLAPVPAVDGDGRVRTLEANMRNDADWGGVVTGLQLDFVGLAPGAAVTVHAIRIAH